ncbi:helix-turn-helix domain-containing protein [Streptomyces sp. NPDC059070]|uniref:helix-turn-helix domain-containing protein n=1 Tax=unclassified Streptomyces TaxID=2593676 RepID=UPI0034E297B6
MSTPHGSAPDRPVLTRLLAAPALRGAVRSYAGYEYGDGCAQRRLVFPDTLVSVGFGLGGGSVRTDNMIDPRDSVSAPSRAVLPVMTAMLGHHQGGVRGVVVRLTPMGAYRLFGVPMSEWDLPHLDPVHLLPRVLRHLPEQLEEADWGERFRTLDRVLHQLLARGPAVSPEVEWAWHELHRTHGQLRVTALSAGTNWSVRQLERRFREQIGRSPAAIARILRFGRALRLRDGGLPLASVAQLAGYHDQAHYNHVFKAMTGLTPTQVPGSPADWSPVDNLLPAPPTGRAAGTAKPPTGLRSGASVSARARLGAGADSARLPAGRGESP